MIIRLQQQEIEKLEIKIGLLETLKDLTYEELDNFVAIHKEILSKITRSIA